MNPIRTLFPILIALTLVGSVSAQEKPKADDKKVKKENVFSKTEESNDQLKDIQPGVGILIEYISLSHTTANELLRKIGTKATDAGDTRKQLDGMIDRGDAELLETAWVRSRSGQRAKTLSVLEKIYPTEYDPPEIPNLIGNIGRAVPLKKGDPTIHMTHGNPAAFETRNVGITLEVDPVIGADQTHINLNLAPEIVKYLGENYVFREGREHTARGVDHISMPIFYTWRETHQIEVADGSYNLLAIHTPHDDPKKRVLIFIRADLISFE